MDGVVVLLNKNTGGNDHERIYEKAPCFGGYLRYGNVSAFRQFCAAGGWLWLDQRAGWAKEKQERLRLSADGHPLDEKMQAALLVNIGSPPVIPEKNCVKVANRDV